MIKRKFDLTKIVNDGALHEGQILYFVSLPKLTCKIIKSVDGQFKVIASNKEITIYDFVTNCLGMYPPDLAAKWVRTEDGETVYDIWKRVEEFQVLEMIQSEENIWKLKKEIC